MARDNRIYGYDDTDMAEGIASSALTPVAGSAGTNISDYWGATKDDSQKSRGNIEAGASDDVRILRKEQAGGGDNEGLDDSTQGGQRHRKGPSTSDAPKDMPPSRFRGMKNS